MWSYGSLQNHTEYQVNYKLKVSSLALDSGKSMIAFVKKKSRLLIIVYHKHSNSKALCKFKMIYTKCNYLKMHFHNVTILKFKMLLYRKKLLVFHTTDYCCCVSDVISLKWGNAWDHEQLGIRGKVMQSMGWLSVGYIFY